jgi:hypothetical protein
VFPAPSFPVVAHVVSTPLHSETLLTTVEPVPDIVMVRAVPALAETFPHQISVSSPPLADVAPDNFVQPLVFVSAMEETVRAPAERTEAMAATSTLPFAGAVTVTEVVPTA